MSASRLLISEPPLQVLPSLARRVGVTPAMVLQQLHYRGLRTEGGWVEKKLSEWQAEDFDFWDVSTIKRAFRELRTHGLIEVEQPRGTDRRNRYRVDYEALESLTEGPPSKGANRPLGAAQDAPLDEGESPRSSGAENPAPEVENAPLSNKGTAEEPTTAEATSSPSGDDVALPPTEERATAPAEEQVDVERELADYKHLLPFVDPVFERLARVAEAKPGSITPTRRAVARLLRRMPNKDFLPVADKFEHYYLDGRARAKPVKDVVATFRNWLFKEPGVSRKTPPPSGAGAERSEQDARRRALADDTRARLEAADR